MRDAIYKTGLWTPDWTMDWTMDWCIHALPCTLVKDVLLLGFIFCGVDEKLAEQ